MKKVQHSHTLCGLNKFKYYNKKWQIIKYEGKEKVANMLYAIFKSIVLFIIMPFWLPLLQHLAKWGVLWQNDFLGHFDLPLTSPHSKSKPVSGLTRGRDP